MRRVNNRPIQQKRAARPSSITSHDEIMRYDTTVSVTLGIMNTLPSKGINQKYISRRRSKDIPETPYLGRILGSPSGIWNESLESALGLWATQAPAHKSSPTACRLSKSNGGFGGNRAFGTSGQNTHIMDFQVPFVVNILKCAKWLVGSVV